MLNRPPVTWSKMTTNPFSHFSDMNNSIVSDEKEEKVVNAPRKPVFKNNFHKPLNCGNCQKKAINRPIRKQPTKLTNSVPKLKAEKIGFSHWLKPHLPNAPSTAPTLTHKIACHIISFQMFGGDILLRIRFYLFRFVFHNTTFAYGG